MAITAPNLRFARHASLTNLILRFFVEAQHAFGHVVIRNAEAVVHGAVVLTADTGRCWILGAVSRHLSLCFHNGKYLWSFLISLWNLIVHDWVHGVLSAASCVRLTWLAPVESLKLTIPRWRAALAIIRSYLSEVRYRYAYISVGLGGEAGRVVGVWNRAGAVKGSPHPVQPLLGFSPHWGAVVRPEVQVIRRDHDISIAAIRILCPQRGIPAPAHLHSEFLPFNHFFQIYTSRSRPAKTWAIFFHVHYGYRNTKLHILSLP